jgi:hypothetical protein
VKPLESDQRMKLSPNCPDLSLDPVTLTPEFVVLRLDRFDLGVQLSDSD